MATETPFDFNQPGNPYSSPADFKGMRPQRTGGLTAISVIAIVLGALGLCSSLLGLASLAFQDQIEKLATQAQPIPRGMPKGELKKQMEFQQDVQKSAQEAQKKSFEVNHRYRGANIGVTLLNLLFSASLLIAGIMVLKLNPTGRTLMIAVFLAAILFEIVRTAVTVSMQLDIAHAMSSAFQGGARDQASALMATTMKVSAYVGMAFGIGWGLLKIVFYAVGAMYLRRPKIRALFGQTPVDQM